MGREGGGLAMPPARLGAWTALLTVLADQGSKLALLYGYDLPARDPLQVGPFVTLTVVWNKGISYGLFQQGTDLGRWLLVGISVLACLAIAVWIGRAGHALLSASLGLILGGAAGNVIDRVAFGAVFDFVHLHAGSLSWYVFNVADAAIVAGVAGLLYDALVADRQRSKPA